MSSVSVPCSLYPVVPGNGRFISESEVVVSNYWFPKRVGEQNQEQRGLKFWSEMKTNK